MHENTKLNEDLAHTSAAEPFKTKEMARGRIELPTRGFSVLCSAN